MLARYWFDIDPNLSSLPTPVSSPIDAQSVDLFIIPPQETRACNNVKNSLGIIIDIFLRPGRTFNNQDGDLIPEIGVRFLPVNL